MPFGDAPPRRRTPHAECRQERVEVRTRDSRQRVGGADLECELLGQIGIETGRQQVVARGNSGTIAGDMQEREVLGMAVDVPRSSGRTASPG